MSANICHSEQVTEIKGDWILCKHKTGSDKLNLREWYASQSDTSILKDRVGVDLVRKQKKVGMVAWNIRVNLGWFPLFGTQH